MPKAIPAQVITEMDAVGKRPCLLFELGLSSTIRFAAYKTNITFPTGGNVYTAKAIQISSVVQATEGQIQRVTVKFDNVKKDMFAYANAEDFRGKSLIIKMIYLDTVGDASYYREIFNGYMEKPSGVSREWLTVPATTGKGLNKKALSYRYTRLCGWLFGESECNTDGLADLTALTASGTADSGSTTTLTDNALTQADDYWNNGEIVITKATVAYYRKVKDFDAASDTITLDMAMPFAIDTDCTYVVYKGCDQVWETCNGDNAWGPSADNKANFGGYIHIYTDPDQ